MRISREDALKAFGKWVQKRREALSLSSQELLCERLRELGVEVSTRAVSKWENGQAAPLPDKREAVWESLGVPRQQWQRVEMALDGWDTFPPVTSDAA